MKLKKKLILLFCTFFVLPYSIVMANEEAKYEVVDKNEIYEIRKYSDRLAVETSRAGIDSNFRKLFNYISGRNDAQEKIAMTTPVTQVEKNGNMTMQFYLPSKFNSEAFKKFTLIFNFFKNHFNIYSVISVNVSHFFVYTSSKNG